MASRLASLIAVLFLVSFVTGASAAGGACAVQQNGPATCVIGGQPCHDEGERHDCATACAQMCNGLVAALPALHELPSLHARPEAAATPVFLATLTRPDPPPPRV